MVRSNTTSALDTDRNLDHDVLIDIEEISESTIELPYDEQKSNKIMNECPTLSLPWTLKMNNINVLQAL